MDIHSHKCDCGHIWTHDRDEIAGQSDEVYDKAHTCTECGSIQKLRYYQPGSSMDTLMKFVRIHREIGVSMNKPTVRLHPHGDFEVRKAE